MEMRRWGQLDCATLFSALSTHRPNEYPLTLSTEETGLASSADGVPVFGASLLRPMNVYAEMMYGGYTDERYTRSQTNFGLNLDLDMWTKGLKAGAFLSFDNYDYLQLALSKVYPTYAVDTYTNSDGEQQIQYTQMKKMAVSTSQTRQSTTLQQTLGWNAFASYQNTFDKHGTYFVKGKITNMSTQQITEYNNQNLSQNITRNFISLGRNKVQRPGFGQTLENNESINLTVNPDGSVTVEAGGSTPITNASGTLDPEAESLEFVGKQPKFTLSYRYTKAGITYQVDEELIRRQSPEADLRFQEW